MVMEGGTSFYDHLRVSERQEGTWEKGNASETCGTKEVKSTEQESCDLV